MPIGRSGSQARHRAARLARCGRTAPEPVRHDRVRPASLLGSANRDPDAFDDPDRLDVGRGASTHLSLGRGIHHCLGAVLARLEGRIALEMLLERFASIRLLDDRPRFRTGIVFRGLYGLPLRCMPA